MAVLAAWELFGYLGRLPSYLIAPSADRHHDLGHGAVGRALAHTAATPCCARSPAMPWAARAASPWGLLAGIARPVERFYEPIISLTYPVPKIVVLPVLIAWLGAGNALEDRRHHRRGVLSDLHQFALRRQGGQPLLVWSARNMGASRLQVFRKVVLPSALPQVLTGLRIGLALAFIVVVASEMQNSRSGLGHLIITAEDNIRFDLMYAAIVAIGLIGFAGDRLLVHLRRRVLAGQMLGRDSAPWLASDTRSRAGTRCRWCSRSGKCCPAAARSRSG